MAGPLGQEVPGKPEPLVNRRSQGRRLSRAQQNPHTEDQPGGEDLGRALSLSTASCCPVGFQRRVLSLVPSLLASMQGGILPQPSLTHPLCFLFPSSSHPSWAASCPLHPAPFVGIADAMT